MRYLGLGLLPVLFATAACQQATLGGPLPPDARFRAPSIAPLRAALVPPGSCEELAASLRADAIERLETDAWQYAQLEPGRIVDVVYEGFPSPTANDANAAPSAGAPRHTETNTQVAGVDEGDFVETDGLNVYLLHDDALYVLDADPPGSLAESSKVAIEGSPLAMYVDNGRAVVVSQRYGGGYGYYPGPWGGPVPVDPGIGMDGGTIEPTFDAGTVPTDPTFDGGVPMMEPAIDAGPAPVDPTYDGGVPPIDPYDGGTMPVDYDGGIGGDVDGGAPTQPPPPLPIEDEVKLSVFDVTTTPPTLVSERYVTGTYADSRRHGDVLRVLVRRAGTGVSTLPPPYPWGYYDGTGFDRASYLDALSAWRDAERARVEAATLDALVGASSHVEGGIRVPDAPDCGAFHLPPIGQADAGLLQVLTFRASEPANVRTTTIAGRPDTIYADQDMLLVAQHDIRFGDYGGITQDRTALHQFAIAGDRTDYVASGALRGSVQGPFAFDSVGGVVRVVATEQFTLEGTELTALPMWQPSDTATRVETFTRAGGDLVGLGTTPAFGMGERVMSSRYVGDRAYVVTFRQVDPLFVVDLADARDPRILGELEIPGFSTYMHPLDAGHLLTIGQEVPVNGVGVWGLALQIFDVRGDTPVLLHKHVLENASSSASWDHHAFVYDSLTGLLGIPVERYDTTFESTLRIFHVDLAGGFSERSSIHHEGYFGSCWDGAYYACSYTASMRRALFIGDAVYAISYAAVTAHPLADVTSVTGLVSLPAPTTYYYGRYFID